MNMRETSPYDKAMGDNWDTWEQKTGEEYELKHRETYSQKTEKKKKDNTCMSASEKKRSLNRVVGSY